MVIVTDEHPAGIVFVFEGKDQIVRGPGTENPRTGNAYKDY